VLQSVELNSYGTMEFRYIILQSIRFVNRNIVNFRSSRHILCIVQDLRVAGGEDNGYRAEAVTECSDPLELGNCDSSPGISPRKVGRVVGLTDSGIARALAETVLTYSQSRNTMCVRE